MIALTGWLSGALAPVAVRHGIAEVRDPAARAGDVVALGADPAQCHRLERRGGGIVDAPALRCARRTRGGVKIALTTHVAFGCEHRGASVREAVGAGDEVGCVTVVERDLIDPHRLVAGVDDGRRRAPEVGAHAPRSRAELSRAHLEHSRRDGRTRRGARRYRARRARARPRSTTALKRAALPARPRPRAGRNIVEPPYSLRRVRFDGHHHGTAHARRATRLVEARATLWQTRRHERSHRLRPHRRH